MRSPRTGLGKNTLTFASVAAALVILLAPSACRRGDRYAETKDLLNRYIATVEEFAAAVEKADDAKTIAGAMDAWTEKARGLAPGIKTLGKTHPELADPTAIPEALKTLLAKMDGAHERHLAAMRKAMQYGDDPAVQAARAKLEVVQKLLE